MTSFVDPVCPLFKAFSQLASVWLGLRWLLLAPTLRLPPDVGPRSRTGKLQSGVSVIGESKSLYCVRFGARQGESLHLRQLFGPSHICPLQSSHLVAQLIIW